jgi:hypothetical protein
VDIVFGHDVNFLEGISRLPATLRDNTLECREVPGLEGASVLCLPFFSHPNTVPQNSRQANTGKMGILDKIAEIEAELSRTQKNKCVVSSHGRLCLAHASAAAAL